MTLPCSNKAEVVVKDIRLSVYLKDKIGYLWRSRYLGLMTERRNKNDLLVIFHKIVDIRGLELALVIKNRRRCFLRLNGVVLDWNLS